MKKFFSLILAVVLVAAMFVPSLAVESKTTFALEDIIENYKPHTEEEINAFKVELEKKGLLSKFLAPDKYAEILVISNREEPYVFYRRERNIYGDKTQIMGVTKDNGFVTMEKSALEINDQWYERFHKDPSKSFDYFFSGYAEDEYYTTEKVQYLALRFDRFAEDRTSQKFLDSLTYEERVNFLLDMYLNILDTEEAIGFTCEFLCGIPNPGDINGDGKINSIDCNTMVRYLAGKNVSIDETNADVNVDGKINSADALSLKKMISGN